MGVQKVNMTNVKSLPGLKVLRCIKHHISSDNPANWKEDINNTFIIVFNYIGYLINPKMQKTYISEMGGPLREGRVTQHSIPWLAKSLLGHIVPAML